MRYRLGDICTITKGSTGIMKAVPGEYTMVALGEANKTHNEFQFDAKAVIIPLVSSTGHGHASMKRVKYQEGKFALGNILCAVIPKDENFVLAKYLQIYLHWNREELLVSQMKGMANVSLPMNRIADVEVIVPSMEEQRHIVELEAKLVEKENEADVLFADQLTQIENLNQAILQEAVQGKLVPQDPNDEPACELLKRIKAEKNNIGLKPSDDRTLNSPAFKGRATKKEKPLPPIKPEEIPFEIPESWVWCRLSEIVRITGGGTPSMMNSAYWNGDIPWVSPKDMKSEFIYDSEMKITEKAVRETTANLIPQGSILIVGRSGILKRKVPVAINKIDCAVNQDMKVYIPTLFEMNRYIQFMFLGMEEIILKRFVKFGMTVHSLKYEEFANMPIPLPPVSEQKRIVVEIEKQLAKTKQLKEYILSNQQATEQLLKALLHEAFVVEETEVETGKKEAKVIELKQLQEKEENYFVKRKVLATYIINQSLNDTQFGDVKFEKLLHLSDYFAIKRNLGQKYYQKVAGPLDNAFTSQFFLQIEKGKWFNRKRIGRQYFFSAGENHSKSLKPYDYFSDEELQRVNKIISYFKKYDYEQPEIISTLYAVWNNRLIKSQELSDQELINDFYDWDEAKRKYSENRLLKAIQWMKDEDFIPDGWGDYIDKPKTNKAAGKK